MSHIETTYLFYKPNKQAQRARRIITEYQKYAIPILNDIAKMIERGDHIEDIHVYFHAMGWEFIDDIWLIARYMLVLDEAQQN